MSTTERSVWHRIFPVGISARLRLAFVVIAAMMGLVTFVTVYQSGLILQAHQQLHSQALPMLSQAKQTQTNLLGLRGQMLETVLIDPVPAGALAAGRVSAKAAAVRRNLEALHRFEIAQKITSSLKENLDRAEVSTLQALVGRRTLYDLAERLDMNVQAIKRSNLNAQALLSEWPLVPPQAAERPSPHRPVSTPPQAKPAPTTLVAQARRMLVLEQIGRELDALTNAVTSAQMTRSSIEVGRAKALAQTQVKQIIGHLPGLPDDPLRQSLGRSIEDLRSLLFGPEGQFALQEAIAEQQETIRDHRGTLEALVRDGTDLTADLVAQSQKVVADASNNLHQAVMRILKTLLPAVALAMVLLFGTFVLVIERQLNARLSELTASVRNIAEGNLDHEITTNGPDELGSTARALQVFKENAQALRRTNRDLEKFAQIAAHDLRSPLQAIRDLCRWTLEDSDNQLSGESQAYLTLLEERVARLNRHLQDLGSYVEIGRLHSQIQSVQLRNIVEAQLRELDPTGRFSLLYDGVETPFRFRAGVLEHICANILANIVKHHDLGAGQIQVYSEILGHNLKIEISDDGPGIPMAYQEKVFELFQTLRPRDEVEGSGLGLAIVKKLIETLQGRIELISSPENARGTRLVILLPLPEQRENLSEDLQDGTVVVAAE